MIQKLFFDIDFQKCPEDVAGIWVAEIDEGASEKYGECTWNPIGYYGNESSQVEFYVHALLLVVIPSFQDRQDFTPCARV